MSGDFQSSSAVGQKTESHPPAEPPPACLACGGGAFLEKSIVSQDKALSAEGDHTVFICADCGSGTTMPYVAEEDLGALYEGDYGSFQDLAFPRGLGWLLALARWTADTIYHRNTPASSMSGRTGDLLEVGCGAGRVGESYIARGWKVVGIEPSPLAAELAGSRGLDVSVGTLGGFDSPGASYDAVMFRHALEHVVAPRDDLKRAFELLRPGGSLLIEIPNFGCWQVRVFGPDWFALGVPTHRSHFTDAGLRRAAEDAGFEVVKTNTGTSPVTLLASVQYKLFDRWLASGKIANSATSIAMLGLFPVSWTVNKLCGSGDVLRMVAVKPSS